MAWLDNWWQVDVVDGYKGPLLLSFVAFVVTFVTTRTITRMIRAGALLDVACIVVVWVGVLLLRPWLPRAG